MPNMCIVYLEIRDGENEYEKTVLVTEENAREIEKNYWALPTPNIVGDIQYNNDYTVGVRHLSTKPLTEEEYAVLSRFL